MATVRELLRGAAGLPGDSAGRDAEVLLGHCLGKPRSWLYTWPDGEVPPAQALAYGRLLEERRRGRPVAYLLGHREFWSLSLEVTADTLIPRPETETLVSWALDLALPECAAVLDLGTGSGAIALALASERPRWQLTGLDASAPALRVAARNARRLGLERVSFLQSDWYAAVAGRRFDLLASNPPYIDPGDRHLDQGDLRFEPRDALVAAGDGLSALSELAAGASAHLHPGGWLLLEHGCEQGAAVRSLLRAAGFEAVVTRADLAGRERVTGGCLADA